MFFFYDENSSRAKKNQPSEQIRADFGLEVADDQVLEKKQQQKALVHYLGEKNCSEETILGKKVLVYRKNGKKFILLHKAISYLGNPHPVFKKRIQIPEWWKECCDKAIAENIDYDIRFVGVYHYKNNVIFVDFAKETYLSHILHNSSAHVYTNDLYQAVRKAA